MKPLIAVLMFLFLASSASADGLPIPVENDEGRVATQSGEVSYASAAKRGWTSVRARNTATGSVIDATRFRGKYTVPLVARDGSPSGLSGDARTLVLINPRKALRPRKRTSFAVLSTDPLRLRRIVRLRGDFSFDAMSPDGRSLFLINYLSARDFRQYRVRVYDLERGRLAPKPIVDPREPPDEMNGYPLTRVVSPGGRWHYTLYDGAKHPFIHALDSRDRKAVCIDLELGHGVDPYSLSMEAAPGGGALLIGEPGRSLAVVDTRTFEVELPPATAAATPPAKATTEAVERGNTKAWLLRGLGGMAIGIGFVAWMLRRSRSRRLREAELDRLRDKLDDLDEPAAVTADRG